MFSISISSNKSLEWNQFYLFTIWRYAHTFICDFDSIFLFQPSASLISQMLNIGVLQYSAGSTWLAHPMMMNGKKVFRNSDSRTIAPQVAVESQASVPTCGRFEPCWISCVCWLQYECPRIQLMSSWKGKDISRTERRITLAQIDAARLALLCGWSQRLRRHRKNERTYPRLLRLNVRY